MHLPIISCRCFQHFWCRRSRPAPHLSHNPEPLPALRGLRQFLQFGLRQFAVGDDDREVIAHLADDVDSEKQLFAGAEIVDRTCPPRGGVVVFEAPEGFAQELVIQKILRADRLGGGLGEFAFVSHQVLRNALDLLRPGAMAMRGRHIGANGHGNAVELNGFVQARIVVDEFPDAGRRLWSNRPSRRVSFGPPPIRWPEPPIIASAVSEKDH